jgi:hypothetical protein
MWKFVEDNIGAIDANDPIEWSISQIRDCDTLRCDSFRIPAHSQLHKCTNMHRHNVSGNESIISRYVTGIVDTTLEIQLSLHR